MICYDVITSNTDKSKNRSIKANEWCNVTYKKATVYQTMSTLSPRKRNVRWLTCTLSYHCTILQPLHTNNEYYYVFN